MSKKEKDKHRGKRILLRTFGCQMNVRDSEVISGLLTTKDYQLTTNPADAEVIIFNTCSVRQHAEDKVWSEIGRIAKRRGQSPAGTVPLVGIIGCMAQNYKEDIFRRAAEVDFVAGPADIDKIPEIIERLRKKGDSPQKKGTVPLFSRKIWETDGEARPEEIYHTGFYEDKEHAYVVISEGCSNYCAYCVVPYVRGGIRHRDHKHIFSEIEEAAAKGIKRVTLLGQNVNAYQDKGVNFAKLIGLVDALPELEEFSFVTSHPKDVSADFFKAMADCAKLKKYLHLPVQSGSDRILKLMNRGYGSKYYLDQVKLYRKIVKGGRLSTDIIVGFPSETKEDFQHTLNLVKSVNFDSAYIFKYSLRLGTAAAKMEYGVPRQEKELRHRALLELQKKISKKRKTRNAQRKT